VRARARANTREVWVVDVWVCGCVCDAHCGSTGTHGERASARERTHASARQTPRFLSAFAKDT